MSIQRNTGLLEKDGPACPPIAPERSGDPVAAMQQDRTKAERWGCASCSCYDPGCAYCTYIHTPVAILFACPQVLDHRR
ncbi:hypothetical protein F8E02_12645 [Methanoculleus sp. Wushi-C6]|uniref:Uncharacterized protein n=1 Tax=Methanoculleus caldifontis TaxID=2651577 RepID=A0ABU3X4E4_9EURY|nr:hypothetical protein [Methanoculleus sp. Wushi-C6]MDV2482821.1 hypothetical protein [Methanoculleus sp. Wushi-C6]